jgi:hypothetical protein
VDGGIRHCSCCFWNMFETKRASFFIEKKLGFEM